MSNAMTPEQQQIAIAEACGLKELHWLSGVLCYDSVHSIPVPDYLNDLNAMHEAVRKLNTNHLCQWLDELDKVCVPVHICQTSHADSVINATAAQRAEAFIRTLKLRKD